MKSTYIYIALVVVLFGGIIAVKYLTGDARTQVTSAYDNFAQCLTDKGVKFYGAYWCPHCQAQKKLFQNSEKLPYIECSTANQQAQTQICIDADIKSYPTWEFADGSRLDGEQTLEALGAKAGCELPASS